MFQETADEGQGGADLDNGGVVVTLTSANNNNTPSLQQQNQRHKHEHPSVVHSPPNNDPITVKDLMVGVIEMQLKRNFNSPSDSGSSAPNSSATPTISSILKTDHRNDITYVRSYKAGTGGMSNNTQLPSNRDSLATLSVVSGPHHGHRSAPSPQQIGKFS